MALLARALRGRDDELAAFYDDLVLAEQRHERCYVELARTVLGDGVAARWRALACHEGAVLARQAWSARLHGGLPAGAELGR